MKRFFNLSLYLVPAVISLTLIISVVDANQTTPYIFEAKAACDLAEFSRIESEFQQMAQLRQQNPTAIPDEVYKAAASAYIENAEFCYEITTEPGLQAQTEPVLIDHGGEWDPHYEPDEDELLGQYVAPGPKWGDPGFGNSGGTVTYSYIPNGVSHTYEGEGPNTFIENLNGYSPCFYTEIETAFAAWSAVADINFVEVVDNGLPSGTFGAAGDIRIGAHAFDGNSGILAHAYFPYGSSISGDLHFDSAENWRCTPSGGFDIGIVTLHEIGHSLGLGHEPMPSSGGNPAVMNPYYNSSLSGLLTDDINGITTIYGARAMGSGISSDPFPVFTSTVTIAYTLQLHNHGSNPLTNVIITNTIPVSTTYVFGSASNGGFESSSGVLTWPSATIAGNASISRTFQVNVTETLTDGEILVNILSATTDQGVDIDNQIFLTIVNPKLIYLPIILR
jgi:uncharacterized repeat protein (TIGR01451 family)